MTAQNHQKAAPEAHSTAGLILSLSTALPNPRSALARAATRIAHRLSTGRATHADHDAAAGILATLLDATDCDLSGFETVGLTDGEFDA